MAKSPNKIFDNTIIRIVMGMFIGALALSVEIFFQQAMMNQDPFVFKSYLVPIVYGGISGMVIAYFITKNQKALIHKFRVEKFQKAKLQKESANIGKTVKILKHKLEQEMGEKQQAQSALRKAKNQIITLSDENQFAGRVLVVDDDVSFLNSLKEKIGGIDINLFTAGSGREGLMKLAQSPIDLVISDYRMPEMSGADFLKNARFDYPNVSRAVLSDFEYHPAVVKMLTEGLATTAFAKPKNGDTKELFDAIIRYLKIRKRINDEKIQQLMTSIDHLPKLPMVFNEFVDAIRRESNYQILAEIISKDVSVATKLMQVANSAFLAVENTGSLEQSIMMLGVNAARDIVLTVSLMEQGSEKAQHVEYLQKIIKHSTVVNKYMDAVSKLVMGKGIDKNSKSVGLTHDIGKIIMLQSFPERFEKIISHMYSQPNINFYESEIALGYEDCTHVEIGAYLLDLWSFPESSIETALFHHHPMSARDTKNSDLIKAVAITNELVNYLNRPVNLDDVNFNNMFKAVKRDLL